MAFLRHRFRTDKLKSARKGLPARGRFFIAVVCLCMCAALIADATRPVMAQEGASEYEVKAAFLFNFAKFVEWPEDAFADPYSPVVIGIIGQDPFNGALDRTISGKSVNGRSLTIKRLSQSQELKTCHIIFVCSSERKRLSQILTSLIGTSVLTVSDMDDFAYAGGVINFVLDNNKVKFQVNSTAAARARLRISSKLLTLARKVIQ